MNPEAEPDEEKILEQLANGLILLSPEQKAQYIELSRPRSRTPEAQQMIERLILLGKGFDPAVIDEYIAARLIAPFERTERQRDVILLLSISETLSSQMRTIIENPELRTLFTEFSNELFVSDMENIRRSDAARQRVENMGTQAWQRYYEYLDAQERNE